MDIYGLIKKSFEVQMLKWVPKTFKYIFELINLSCWWLRWWAAMCCGAGPGWSPLLSSSSCDHWVPPWVQPLSYRPSLFSVSGYLLILSTISFLQYFTSETSKTVINQSSSVSSSVIVIIWCLYLQSKKYFLNKKS